MIKLVRMQFNEMRMMVKPCRLSPASRWALAGAAGQVGKRWRDDVVHLLYNYLAR